MQVDTTVRDIHVVVDLGGEQRPVAVAIDLAQRLGAHLTGVALAFQPIIPVYTMAAPVPADFIVSAQEHVTANAKAATDGFTQRAQSAGLMHEARNMESTAGDGFINAVQSFMLSDLVVVGQQNPDRLEPMREGLIEALLFQAGVPILLVPHSGVEAFNPGKVVIGWDGGAAAARTVRMAMPLLRQADLVQVVTVAEARKVERLAGLDIGQYLARHDLNVETREMEPVGGDAAHTLLSFAASQNAGWIVMGAYGHSRLREFFLGGATRGMLSEATVPVFMAH